VRGQDIDWTEYSVYYNRTSAFAEDLDILNFSATWPTGFLNATDDLSLKSGECMVIYIDSPGTISVQDTGVTCSITVFTASAQYKVEVNVESAS